MMLPNFIATENDPFVYYVQLKANRRGLFLILEKDKKESYFLFEKSRQKGKRSPPPNGAAE